MVLDERDEYTVQTHGSREMVSRVEVTRPATDPYLTGQSGSGRSGRVGSGGVQNLTGRVKSM